jgi:predicted DNA-binding transcriptional regulator AlpA
MTRTTVKPAPKKDLLAPPEPFITRREMRELCKVGESTLDRWAREGTIPKPSRIGPRRVGWPQSVVKEILWRFQTDGARS